MHLIRLLDHPLPALAIFKLPADANKQQVRTFLPTPNPKPAFYSQSAAPGRPRLYQFAVIDVETMVAATTACTSLPSRQANIADHLPLSRTPRSATGIASCCGAGTLTRAGRRRPSSSHKFSTRRTMSCSEDSIRIGRNWHNNAVFHEHVGGRHSKREVGKEVRARRAKNVARDGLRATCTYPP